MCRSNYSSRFVCTTFLAQRSVHNPHPCPRFTIVCQHARHCLPACTALFASMHGTVCLHAPYLRALLRSKLISFVILGIRVRPSFRVLPRPTATRRTRRGLRFEPRRIKHVNFNLDRISDLLQHNCHNVTCCHNTIVTCCHKITVTMLHAVVE